jgi:toxin ParE1/3/4
MLVDNYSVFYTIRDERVIVTDVLYTASGIEARLRGEL